MEPIWAVGTMSGTSLDGVDAAQLLTDGIEIFDFGPSAYRPYAPTEQKLLRNHLGAWHDDPGVTEVAEIVEAAHIDLLQDFAEAEVIGFQNKAEAAGWKRSVEAFSGDGDQFARYVLLQKLSPSYRKLMINTADSPIMKIFDLFQGQPESQSAGSPASTVETENSGENPMTTSVE